MLFPFMLKIYQMSLNQFGIKNRSLKNLPSKSKKSVVGKSFLIGSEIFSEILSECLSKVLFF